MKEGGRHHGLDGVRGLCALVVATYHFLSWMGIAHVKSMGLYAVYVFFILSATTLCIVYGSRFRDAVLPQDLRAYLVSRIARIMPLLIAAAVLNLALQAALGERAWTAILAKFLFTGGGLFAFAAPGLMSNTTGAWSLGIEIMFYLLFPVLCIVLMRWSRRAVLVTALLFLGAQVVYAEFLLSVGSLEEQWPNYILLLSFSFYFLAGFAIYGLGRQRSRLNLPLGIALLAVAISQSTWLPSTPEALLTFPMGVLNPLLMAGGVYLVFNATTPQVLVGVFEFLGAISYSSYLLHPFVLRATRHVAGRFELGPWEHLALFLPLTILCSYLSFRVFEAPARDLIRRIWAPKPDPLPVLQADQR